MGKFALALIVLVFLLDLSAWAIDPRTGGTTLLETLDARAAALGQAGTTLTGDLAGASFNPAVYPTLENPQLETQFQVAPGDVHTALLAYGRGGPRLGWGAALVVLDAGTVETSSVGGAPSTVRAQQDIVGTLSAGVAPTSWLKVGGTVKGLQSKLAEEYSASTVAADVGLLIDLPLPGLRLGGAVQNMGPDLTFRSEGDPLPLFYRVGLSHIWTIGGEDDLSPIKPTAWYARDERPASVLWVGADAVFDRWGECSGHLGLEWDYNRLAILRLGGIVGEDGLGPTGGIGFWINKWRFDYAIQLVDELTDRHRVTVSYFWRD
ncbi:MAG: hypothetical protein IPN19_04175 [Elusimicrobia bacterium]|nr:hypothetical protein [Elusimicrobiota bacterium]